MKLDLSVSIVICTYNGLSRLPETLDFIVKQKSKISFELIIVDNNSSDFTNDFVKEYLKDSEIDWKIVSETKAGLSYARWRGIEESKYELVLFCDDDNHLAENYIEIGAFKFSNNPNLGILGGLGSPKFESQKPTWFDDFSHSYAVGSLGKEPGIQAKGSWHYGAGCFFRKSALIQLKLLGFKSVLSDRKGGDLSSGGDVELCYAVQLLGFDLAFDPTLRFDHFIEAHRLDWDYYLKLNRGIASSFPLLESYQILSFNSRTAFMFHLIKILIMTMSRILKLKFTNKPTLHEKVNYEFMKDSLKVFKRNFNPTIFAFDKNREFFRAFV